MTNPSSALTQAAPGSLTQLRFQRNPEKTAQQISILTSVLMSVVAVVFISSAYQDATSNYSFLASLYIMGVIGVFFTSIAMTIKYTTRMVILVSVMQITLILSSVFVQGIGVISGLIILIFTTIISSATLEGRQSDYVLTVGIFSAMAAALVNSYSPFSQVTLSAMDIYLPSLLGILIMVYIALLSTEFISVTLRIKMLTAMLAIVLVPLIFLTFLSTQFTQTATIEQTNKALHLAASATASKIDEFLATNRESVANDASLPVFANYLITPLLTRHGSQAEADLTLLVNSLSNHQQQEYLSSYGILNYAGKNVFDTNQVEVGGDEGNTDYFTVPVKTGQVYTSSVQFSPKNGDPFIYFSAPIRDSNQRIVGVLRIRYDALILQRILEQDVGVLGARSYPILLDENLIRLGDTITPNLIYRSVAPLSRNSIITLNAANRLPKVAPELLSTEMKTLASSIRNYQDKPFFVAEMHTLEPEHTEAGTVVTIRSMPWYLVFVQEQAGLNDLLANQGKVSTLVATLIAGLVSAISTFLAANLSQPIYKLTKSAEKISQGDLTAHTDVDSNDEFGALAETFNSMTGQLQTFVNELEDRVQSRTEELAQQNQFLQFRSRQLETVSEVARSITAASEIESLLSRVTTLISERFGFYHVGIFLVDDQNEFAVLRAANSEGGQRMLARQHKLLVGQVGIIGFVTGKGEPRIATDVGKDAVFFNNPDLPRTRSEMGLPLRIGEQIIGALDVQSELSDAFSQEDVELFSILADQISIAISNNRLLAETARALEEMRKVHQQYLKQEWGREISEQQHPSFRYTQQGLQVEPLETSPEAQSVLQQGKPYIRQSRVDELGVLVPAMVALPVMVRGEAIGVIRLNESSTRDFTEEEIETASLVADQVGQALENARLFEQTMRRAERERKVLEITSRIRSVNDPETMMQIAVDELQRTLNASRAQILVKAPPTDQPIEPPSIINNNGNGHHPEA